MHFVQPMHSSGTIRATRRGPSTPHAVSRGTTGRPVAEASAAMPAAPPGGQRSIGAASSAIAAAYGRQPAWPHFVHWVWGSSASIASTRASSRPAGRRVASKGEGEGGFRRARG
jgi:hypothetical protein